MKLPMWQLHRGFWQEGCRENSMESFEAAAKLGSQMIEFDVQVNKEKQAHAFHDFDLKRLFNIDAKFSKQSNSDLQKLGVPKLVDILDNNKIPYHLNIELKSNSLFCFSLVRSVVADIKASRQIHQVLLSSFNPLCLFWACWLLPHAPRALIVGDSKVVLGWQFLLYRALSRPEYLNVHADLLEEPRSRKILIGSGLKLAVWTVNELKRAQHLMTLGAVSVISDWLPYRN